jgi:hypothetical protein
MIHDSDFDIYYEDCHELKSCFNCDNCNVLVERITYYEYDDSEETFFTITDIEDDEE